jgi:AcrR family transcriptional regulator
MPDPDAPKFRRRKADRPAEILKAALDVFARNGFAATRLDEVARQAGVSKGALYLYFETKEALFREAIRAAVQPNLERIRMLSSTEAPFEAVARMAVGGMALAVAEDRRIGRVIKLVVAESANLPELGAIWHETVISPALGAMTGLIRRAQADGAVRDGDARYYAFGLISPVLLGTLWRETFEPTGAEPVDIEALVSQHLDTVLRGMKP